MGHLEVPLASSCSNSSNLLFKIGEKDEDDSFKSVEENLMGQYLEVRGHKNSKKNLFERLLFRLNLILNSTLWKIGNIFILGLFICSLFYFYVQNSYLNSINSIQPDFAVCSCSGTETSSSNHHNTLNSKWDEKGSEMITELQDLLESPLWKFYKKSPEGIDIFVHPEGNKWKASGIVPGSPDMFLKTFTDDYELWPNWDPSTKNATILRHLTKHTKLIYQIESAYFGFLRDALCLLHYSNLPTGKSHYAFVLKSVIWPDETKRNENIVRAVFRSSGAKMKPTGDGKTTKFELAFDADFRIEWLPVGKDFFLANFFMQKVTSIFKKLKNEK